MKYRCFNVNGKDAWRVFGVWVAEGGYTSFIQWAALKGVVSNDWWESDFEEVDTSRATLDARDVSITFYAKTASGYRAFMNELRTDTFASVTAIELGIGFALRYVSQKSYSESNGLVRFELLFSDDNPDFWGGVDSSAMTTLNLSSPYCIDGNSMAMYGAVVTGGTLSSVNKYPNNKKNFEQNNEFSTGQRYGGSSHLSGRDVSVNILMRAATRLELINNYTALYKDIIDNDFEHTLTNEETGLSVKFYYKSQRVNKVYTSGKLWIEFSVTLHIYEQ